MLAHTARGEEILHSFLEWGLLFPPQQLTSQPTVNLDGAQD